MDGAIKPNQGCYWASHANQGSYTIAAPSAWVVKGDQGRASFSPRRQDPQRNKDKNTKDMTEDEDTFHHRKLSTEKGIKDESDEEKCKSKERSLPILIDVVLNI
jgi:hypothetical protein